MDKLTIDAGNTLDALRYHRDRSKAYYVYNSTGGRQEVQRQLPMSATEPYNQARDQAPAPPAPLGGDQAPPPEKAAEDAMPKELARRLYAICFGNFWCNLIHFDVVNCILFRSRQQKKFPFVTFELIILDR